MTSTRSFSQIRHHTDFLRQSVADFDAEISVHPPDESTKDFLVIIKSFMIAVNGEFSQHHDPIAFIEADLHHIWYMVIEVAKITQPEDTTHDGLVLLLLYFMNLGTLTRMIEDIEEKAVIGDGRRLWTDLPLFGADLLAGWRGSGSIPIKQRVNLAVFTGKCVAHGVGGDDIVLSALWLLKEALEGDGEHSVPIAKMLPACTALLQNCCHKLLILCIGKDQRPASELSMERWLSWRKRFQELSQSQDEILLREAKSGFDSMINCGREMGFEIEGEKRYWTKVMGLLEEELIRSGKESIGLEDIVTDPDWVD
ncbi:hypothetical protein N431DRAFT_438033 [Stipitochalara longipes BDJ]|nr:hypothetical protein N431DRAFT_438033 [Stipitochalara longipes BDJ]